jgi:pentatricopeptide repeat protein
MKPDKFMFPSILRACASIVSLGQGKQLHVCIIKTENEPNIILESSLVDMYVKCGTIKDARQAFDKIPERNVVSWTAIIVGYGRHGDSKEVFVLFEQMQQLGLKPNYVTLLAILNSCSHVFLVDEAWHYFESIHRDYHIKPRVEHYSCRTGLFMKPSTVESLLPWCSFFGEPIFFKYM